MEVLFDLDGTSFLPAQKIDTTMATDLFKLPFAPNAPNLAFRNLIRGEQTFGLLSGEEVSLRLFNQAAIPLHQKVIDANLTETPLWFYVLAEAEHTKLDESITLTS